MLRAFQTFAIVFSTPENLLVGISGALGTKEKHNLCKNVFWENAVDYLTNSECESFQISAIVFSTPEILLVGISGSQGMWEVHYLSKMYFEKMLWSISQTVNARALKPLPLCSAPLKTYL